MINYKLKDLDNTQLDEIEDGMLELDMGNDVALTKSQVLEVLEMLRLNLEMRQRKGLI